MCELSLHIELCLFSILNDPLISYERKKPFATLLSYAYVFTERDSLVSIATLVNDKPFWQHVEQCGVVLCAIQESIQQSGRKEQVRIKVRALMTEFISIPVCLRSWII